VKFPLLLLLFVFSIPSHALELFGIDLVSAKRDQLRTAVKSTGVKLLSEAGDDAFYDIYESNGLLDGSTRLFLGFVKKDKSFAFVEYVFDGLKHPQMLKMLQTKYGKSQKLRGDFQTDASHTWIKDGVNISFYKDWHAYKTRLTYYVPKSLKVLKAEMKQFKARSMVQGKKFSALAY